MRYFLLILILISCQQAEKDIVKEESDEKQSEDKIDLQNLDEEFINKILNKEINSDSLIYLLNPSLAKEKYNLEYNSSEVNLDEDTEKEIVITSLPKNNYSEVGYIFVIDSKPNKYSLIGFEYLDLWFENIPIIDFGNKMIFLKSRVNGTCDAGYYWSGYKLLDNEFKNIASLYGNHEGSSCGNYEDEDDDKKDIEIRTTLESTFEFQDKNTIINNCTLSEWKFDTYMDTYTEKIITDKEIKLYYIYNPTSKKFECFNSEKKKLFEDGIIGTSFELITKFKNGEL